VGKTIVFIIIESFLGFSVKMQTASLAPLIKAL